MEEEDEEQEEQEEEDVERDEAAKVWDEIFAGDWETMTVKTSAMSSDYETEADETEDEDEDEAEEEEHVGHGCYGALLPRVQRITKTATRGGGGAVDGVQD